MKLRELILGKAVPTSAQLREALSRDDVVEAERTLFEVRAARARALLDASDDDMRRLDDAVREAATRVERAQAVRGRAQQLLAEAEAREDAELRQRRYDAATKLGPQARRLIAEYEKRARAVMDPLRQLYEIEAQVFEANRNRPEGAPRIPSPEADARGGGRRAMIAAELHLPLPSGGALHCGEGSTEHAEPGKHAREVADLIASRLQA